MFKVCLYVIDILLLNWGLEGRSVRTPGWQHGVCHFPLPCWPQVWNIGFGACGSEFGV